MDRLSLLPIPRSASPLPLPYTGSSRSTAAKRALISVPDKTGFVNLAQGLRALDVEIVSTGRTARLSTQNGVSVTEISDYTGFPEMMDGRLKTLHPKVYGGVLGRRGTDDAAMAEHGMAPTDMVVVNLYPFENQVADPGCSLGAAITNTHTGEPALLRAAAPEHGMAMVFTGMRHFRH